MGALQEARFYVIIGVIMLIGILGYFFTLQSTMGVNSFLSTFQEQYTEVKSVSQNKTLRDIITTDGITLNGTTGNQLFGLTLEGTPDDITYSDNFILGTTDIGGGVQGQSSSPGKFRMMFFIRSLDVNSNELDWDNNGDCDTIINRTSLGSIGGYIPSQKSGTDGVDEGLTVRNKACAELPGIDIDLNLNGTVSLGELNSQKENKTLSVSTRGWTFESEGYIGFLFENTTIAKEVIGKYLPSGTLLTANGQPNLVVIPFKN